MLSLLTDDVERQEVGSSELIRGKEAFERNMAPPPDVESLRSTRTRMTEEGNVVVAEGTVLVKKKDGTSMNIQFCNVFEFEGERVKRLTSFAALVPNPT